MSCDKTTCKGVCAQKTSFDSIRSFEVAEIFNASIRKRTITQLPRIDATQLMSIKETRVAQAVDNPTGNYAMDRLYFPLVHATALGEVKRTYKADFFDLADVINQAVDGGVIRDGKSAYELWLEAGNTGTLQDFFDSLIGLKGDKGDPGSVIPGTDFEPSLSLYGWTHNIPFTVKDADSIQWGNGNLTLSDGTTIYNIVAGDSGNMTGLTWIYFDKSTPTVLKTTSNPSTATGLDRIIVAVAEPAEAPATQATLDVLGGSPDGIYAAKNIAARSITANLIATNSITATELAAGSVQASKIAAGSVNASHIAANAVTATKINTTSLSAISATLGSVTAGDIRGSSFRTRAGYDGSPKNEIKIASNTGRIDFGLTDASSDGFQEFGSIQLINSVGSPLHRALSIESGATILVQTQTAADGVVLNSPNGRGIFQTNELELRANTIVEFRRSTDQAKVMELNMATGNLRVAGSVQGNQGINF